MADTQPRRPGRPRKYDENTVSVSCRLTVEQVRFLDAFEGNSRSEALAIAAGAGIRLIQGLQSVQEHR